MGVDETSEQMRVRPRSTAIDPSNAPSHSALDSGLLSSHLSRLDGVGAEEHQQAEENRHRQAARREREGHRGEKRRRCECDSTRACVCRVSRRASQCVCRSRVASLPFVARCSLDARAARNRTSSADHRREPRGESRSRGRHPTHTRDTTTRDANNNDTIGGSVLYSTRLLPVRVLSVSRRCRGRRAARRLPPRRGSTRTTTTMPMMMPPPTRRACPDSSARYTRYEWEGGCSAHEQRGFSSALMLPASAGSRLTQISLLPLSSSSSSSPPPSSDGERSDHPGGGELE